MDSAEELRPFLSMPVGEFIKDELELRGWDRMHLASITQIPSNEIDLVINGQQKINYKIAKKLGEVFGQSAEFWLNLDRA
jgi:plasmid maintenance system antidote protein VapI